MTRRRKSVIHGIQARSRMNGRAIDSPSQVRISNRSGMIARIAPVTGPTIFRRGGGGPGEDSSVGGEGIRNPCPPFRTASASVAGSLSGAADSRQTRSRGDWSERP